MNSDLKWLRVHVRRTQTGNGSSRVLRSVYCPNEGGHALLDECGSCPHRFAIDRRDREMFLICDSQRKEIPSDEIAKPEEEPSDRELVRIRDVMTHDVVCVSPDLQIDSLLLLLFEQNISGAPVVDADGAPLGVVSKTDVLRALQGTLDDEDGGRLVLQTDDGIDYELGAEFRLDVLREMKVRDVMTDFVFSLPEDAAVERAAAIMAYEGVHRVPIVSGDNKVVGLLSSLDVLRWMGRHAGYVLPHHKITDPPP